MRIITHLSIYVVMRLQEGNFVNRNSGLLDSVKQAPSKGAQKKRKAQHRSLPRPFPFSIPVFPSFPFWEFLLSFPNRLTCRVRCRLQLPRMEGNNSSMSASAAWGHSLPFSEETRCAGAYCPFEKPPSLKKALTRTGRQGPVRIRAFLGAPFPPFLESLREKQGNLYILFWNLSACVLLITWLGILGGLGIQKGEPRAALCRLLHHVLFKGCQRLHSFLFWANTSFLAYLFDVLCFYVFG